jgi:hypothetical protein
MLNLNEFLILPQDPWDFREMLNSKLQQDFEKCISCEPLSDRKFFFQTPLGKGYVARAWHKEVEQVCPIAYHLLLKI